METHQIQTDPGFTVEIDKSCVEVFWENVYDKPTIYDAEFEKVWNDKLGIAIGEGIPLYNPLYFDENCEHEMRHTSWSKFWEELQSTNHILLEVNETFIDADNSLVSNGLSDSIWYCYLINTQKATELLNEDFQADAEWIKQKFQVKR